MSAPDWLETILFAVLATLKFALAVPFFILEERLSFWEALLFSVSSGTVGILVFTFLSRKLLKVWKWIKHKISFAKPKAPKKVFTRRNRKLVRTKAKYGLIGIALLSPVLLSLPLGCFLAVRFYKNRKKVFIYMFGGVILWSMIFSTFASMIVKLLKSFDLAIL